MGSGAWGILGLDAASGTVYMPTDSGSPDYVGIWRPGDNAGTGATIALDAETGRVNGLSRTFITISSTWIPMRRLFRSKSAKAGKGLKVVVQTTKQGMIWILDAGTGKPVFPYEERSVEQSQVPGEKTSPTQPFTILPPPLLPATVSRDHLSQLSARANEECKALWDANKLRDVTPFSPPRPDGAWGSMSIGAIGGVDWGGAAIDLDHDYAIINVANMPTMITVTKTKKASKAMAVCAPPPAMSALPTMKAEAAMAAGRAS